MKILAAIIACDEKTARAALADEKSCSQGNTVRSRGLCFPIYLHVVLVINRMAFEPNARLEYGGGKAFESHTDYNHSNKSARQDRMKDRWK